MLESEFVSEDQDIQFMGRGVIAKPKAIVGEFNMVVALQARDELDQTHDLRVLSSKLDQVRGGQVQLVTILGGQSHSLVSPKTKDSQHPGEKERQCIDVVIHLQDDTNEHLHVPRHPRGIMHL